MATFLTNPKMAPALAARIEASVRGRGAAPGGGVMRLRLSSLFRLGALATIVLAVGSLMFARQRDRDELERSRGALLDAIHAHGSSLATEDKDAVARAESWLIRASGAYEGDLIAGELRAEGALAALLARPAVYVRGPLEGFRTSVGIAATAATSLKDSLLLCLLERPASRAEKLMLAKVHGAYLGGTRMEARTPNVRRLYEAEAGLPFLAPAWALRVQGAKDARELARLERSFAAAPLEAAKRAAAARLLVFAMDEPGEPGGVSELDGEHVHHIRVGLVDLTAGTVLLRFRKRVDPGWISVPRRADYAAALDACALALDIHEAASAPGG
jgi:hypothetical protein